MSKPTQHCDDILFQMTQELGKGPEGILDTVLGFLFRRTDFYYQAEPGAKMGFPPNYASNMIYGIYKAYQDEHFKRFPQDTTLEDKWKKFQKEQIDAQKEKAAERENKGKNEGEHREKGEGAKVEEII